MFQKTKINEKEAGDGPFKKTFGLSLFLRTYYSSCALQFIPMALKHPFTCDFSG